MEIFRDALEFSTNVIPLVRASEIKSHSRMSHYAHVMHKEVRVRAKVVALRWKAIHPYVQNAAERETDRAVFISICSAEAAWRSPLKLSARNEKSCNPQM